MIYCFLLVCFSFCFELSTPHPLFVVENTTWYDVDFYEQVFKEDWDALSLSKKEGVFQDFLSQELVCYLATSLGFHNNPKIKRTLDLRKRALLINNTYEHLIARPLIPLKDIKINKENLLYKTEAYHLLVGFSGSKQNTGALLSQEQAFRLIDSLRVEINKEASLDFNLTDVFSRFALNFSMDPSVKDNKGFLGWVPWGGVVMSFQQPLFKLNLGVVSNPILTPFGYHLALKTDFSFSNYYYYTSKHYNDLSYKISQNSLPFDSLKVLSSRFDSLLIKTSGLRFNHQHLNDLFLFLEEQQKTKKMLGNKNLLIEWLQAFPLKGVLFVSNNKGFGVLWMINKLKNTPSSRVPSIKTKKDCENLIVSFVLQEEVLSLSKINKIDTTTSFLRDWSNNYKNIIYSEYLSSLNSQVGNIDSLAVISKYNKGIYKNQYINPQRAVFMEVRVFSDSLGALLYNKIKKGVLFDSLVVQFGGAIREPVSSGAKSPLGEALFILSPGGVSPVIKNNDGSFSVVRLESFLPAEPFTLNRMYSQIELGLKRERQDSVRKNLFKNLLNDLSPTVHYNILGLK